MPQAPISRHPSVTDGRLVGKTTMRPQRQSKLMRPTGADHRDRHEYFRGHALAGPSMRSAMGGLGDSDHGYTAKPATSGGAVSRSGLHSGFSFGSPSPHQDEPIQYRHGGISTTSYQPRQHIGRRPAY
jgi:hypothetical protein